MSGTLTAADATACASRSYEVQQLAGRVASCAEQTGAVLASLGRLELQAWQSPGGPRLPHNTVAAGRVPAARPGRVAGRGHGGAAARPACDALLGAPGLLMTEFTPAAPERFRALRRLLGRDAAHPRRGGRTELPVRGAAGRRGCPGRGGAAAVRRGREADGIRRSLFEYQTDSYRSGSDAIISVGEAGRDVGRVRAELEHISAQVRASHREYEFTEARNALLLRVGLSGPEYGSAQGPFELPGVRDQVEHGVASAPRGLALLLGLPVRSPAPSGRSAGPPMSAVRCGN